MSRTKKSRNPSASVFSTPKTDKKLEPIKQKKPKKKTGKQAGNRQTEAKVDNKPNKTDAQNKDPRIGNKTPIVLGSASTTTVTKVVPASSSNTKTNQKATHAPIAAIRVVEPDNSLEQELYAIEEDQQLQVILTKQEDNVALNEEEITYFNHKMARHQEISELLGIDNDDEDSDDSLENGQKKSRSEDDLWDKLDNTNLSDY